MARRAAPIPKEDTRPRFVSLSVADARALDAYTAAHPLKPARCRVVSVALAEFLERNPVCSGT